ncbi:hypothetical protein ACJJTC_013491 [Scirpophaga incertulas]
MESPVVIDKPPEYHGNAKDNERGFPFDEEEGSGAWSELAARHPDIAARLRQRPANWARKRRPSSQDATEDFGDRFGGFDRFPFDDIPPEFREHFPTNWNRRFSPRDETQPQPQPPGPQPSTPQQQTTATQTEDTPGPSNPPEHTHLPQYGLRNTVDLGQKSPADPSLVDAEERTQRSMSAPPDSSTVYQSNIPKMSAQSHHEQTHHPQHSDHPQQQQSNVRHIPIFVEGRDEPVINKNVDHSTNFGDAKPAFVPPQQQQTPHMDRERYFPDDGPTFNPPPNFSRSFGTPFNKGFRQGSQPFAQQKVYPQAAFNRGASPQRSQSPKPQMHAEEHFVKVPVHHEHKQEAPRTQQQKPQHQQQQPPPTTSQHQQSPPPQPKPQQQNSANDPITQILGIQTDVLNLMTEVENFTGTKKDKKYLYLDEMLTRNLIKLDNIETDGKENIRQARKEAIRCIQKCIAVLEAKAEKGSSTPQSQDVDMNNTEPPTNQPATENGVEVEMKEASNEKSTVEPQTEQQQIVQPQEEQKGQLETEPVQVPEVIEKVELQAADTRPEPNVCEQISDIKEKKEQEKPSPKKGSKNIKKRDKSKDKKEPPKDSNKDHKTVEKVDVMQTDDKGEKIDTQAMEVDSAASQ